MIGRGSIDSGSIVNSGVIAFSGGPSDVIGQMTNFGILEIAGNSAVTLFDDFNNTGELIIRDGSQALFISEGELTASSLTFELGDQFLSLGDGMTRPNQLTSSSAFSLDGLLTLELLEGFLPERDEIIVLAEASQLSGAFDNAISGSRIATRDGVGSFQINYGSDSQFGSNRVVLSNFAVAVPEPSSFAVLTAISAFALRRRRRQE